MNLLLLSTEDFVSSDKVLLQGRRKQHLLSVIGAEVGQTLRVGLINGSIGDAVVDVIDSDGIALTVNLHNPAPKPLPLTLVLVWDTSVSPAVIADVELSAADNNNISISAAVAIANATVVIR